MKSFFKMVLAALLALVLFSVMTFFLLVGWIAGLATRNLPRVKAGSVLVVDLGEHFAEQRQPFSISLPSGQAERNVPGLYELIQLIHRAQDDKRIRGIYLQAGSNANGFAASQEIRRALQAFRSSGKFILAYGDQIPEKAYWVASVADQVYANPQGGLSWAGFHVEYLFLKGALDKLQIEPQIFYAGKFKSATEPLRTDRMTEENRLQTREWLQDIYGQYLTTVAAARGTDSATLRRWADEGTIQTARDALDHHLLDGLKYEDEVHDLIRQRLGLGSKEKISFVPVGQYAEVGVPRLHGGDLVALIFAEGDIVDGRGGPGRIASAQYTDLIRQARLDDRIKAIVLRINSGGGSSLASEKIWRELFLARQAKPVVVSFGDLAASGAYYLSCGADSLFAEPATLTGSIGVFGVIPNLETFFRNKLGVTFDGVKTSPSADAGSFYRPLSLQEKKQFQADIDRIYRVFKERVAAGRHRDTAYVETVAQGRVWTGNRGAELGLVDRFGGIGEALDCAARMAHLKSYRVQEYPAVRTFLEQLLGTDGLVDEDAAIRRELGEQNFAVYQAFLRVREMTGGVQARLPFQFFIH
ncbi:MAG TPA: signal peptide peptidase SppA [Chitinophagaceae bacterium]|nr:signal peptide peptidase SppA [Chitinophagaceae bacterium]